MKNSIIQIILVLLFLVAFQVIASSQIHVATTPAGYNVLRFQNTNGNILLSGMTSFPSITNAANNNIAVGDGSLSAMVSAEGNVSIGSFALANNTAGDDNIAIGEDALRYSLAERNIAIGKDVLKYNTANDNSAMGHQALQDLAVGYNNTSIGFRSGRNLTSGIDNTFVGSSAFINLMNGNGNTALGTNAGSTSANDNLCVFVGYNAKKTGSTVIQNSIAIGNETYVASSNTVRIGNNQIESIGGYQNWTNYSDASIKVNLDENVAGLSFITKLRPVTYQIDRSKAHFLTTGESTPPSLSGRISGFVAQEVEQTLKSIGYECSIVDNPDPNNPTDLYGIRYAELVVPLVKAVQELEARIVKLEREIMELREK